jgi:hypothetical protein
MLLGYFVNYFETVPVAPVKITSIIIIFYIQNRTIIYQKQTRVYVIIIIIIIIIIVVSCHRPFLPGTSLEPAVIPTAQASSVTLHYFPYYM